MSSAGYRWLAWQPGQNIPESPRTEPPKPPKPGSVGFGGATPGESQIFRVPESEPCGLTAAQTLAEVGEAGGWFRVLDGKLTYGLGHGSAERLEPAIHAHEADLLVLLRPLELPCITCGGVYQWQRQSGEWCCATCEPDPRAARMAGITLAVLGDRPISTTPPTSDLPAPGYWYRTPRGNVGEVVLYEATGAELLLRDLRSGQLGWFRPETLVGELDWGWPDAAAAAQPPAVPANRRGQ
jgi:hypothetical protein